MKYTDASEKLTLTGCCFVPGDRGPQRYAVNANKLPLGQVEAVAFSEVLNDLMLLTAKAGADC